MKIILQSYRWTACSSPSLHEFSPFYRIMFALKCFTVFFPLYFTFDLGKCVMLLELNSIYHSPFSNRCSAGERVPSKKKKLTDIFTAKAWVPCEEHTSVRTASEYSSICPSHNHTLQNVCQAMESSAMRCCIQRMKRFSVQILHGMSSIKWRALDRS